MTRAEIAALLEVCEATDDDDPGSLDAFRAAATVGVVAELARLYLRSEVAQSNRPRGLTG